MRKVTTWSPDTCECTLHYEWDSDLSAEDRVHTPVPYGKRWHVIVDDEATLTARLKWAEGRDRLHAEIAAEIGWSVAEMRERAANNCMYLPMDDNYPGEVTKFADTYDVIPSRCCRDHCRHVGDIATHFAVVLAENQRKNRLRGMLAEYLGIRDELIGHLYSSGRRLSLVVPQTRSRALRACGNLLASVGSADVGVVPNPQMALRLPPWVRRLFSRRKTGAHLSTTGSIRVDR